MSLKAAGWWTLGLALVAGLALTGAWLADGGPGQARAADAAAGTESSGDRAENRATLRLAGIFGDQMVLQREKPVPVWGWTKPGGLVRVTFRDHAVEARAEADGRWMVRLPAMAGDSLDAAGQHLAVWSEGQSVVVHDVLVGEVWLCGGQSNMEWPVRSSADPEATAAGADVPTIRLFKVVPYDTAESPQTTLPGEANGAERSAVWQACSPETVPHFSAVGYAFGRRIHDQLQVPVGLISSVWGGTRIDAWISRAGLEATPEARPVLADFDAIAAAWANRPDQTDALPEFHEDPGDPGGPRAWANAIPAPGDTADEPGSPSTPIGRSVSVPLRFDRAFDGAAWLYRKAMIPEAWAGVPLSLELGMIDDHDVAYVNGVEVGRMDSQTPQWWQRERRYAVPAEAVTPGEALVAVRVFDIWGDGGMLGPASLLRLVPADGDLRGEAAVSLADGWTVRESVWLDPDDITGPNQTQEYGPGHRQQPAGLYNAMIHPLVPYAMRGAIWYQGESNAGRAEQYRALLPALIRDWRRAWSEQTAYGLGREPTDGPGEPFWFGVVQLANFQAFHDRPVEDAWAELRDAQLHTVRHVARTGLAVTIDIGDPDDIHPKNKDDVGDRLARWALTETYRVPNIVMAGPRMDGVWFDAGRAFVRFETFGSTLAKRAATGTHPASVGTELSGFTLAGDDRIFHHATATIAGPDRVELRSDAVAKPVAVRYAWQQNPADADLINAEGLPAGPFRSDDWPGVTAGQRVP